MMVNIRSENCPQSKRIVATENPARYHSPNHHGSVPMARVLDFPGTAGDWRNALCGTRWLRWGPRLSVGDRCSMVFYDILWCSIKY